MATLERDIRTMLETELENYPVAYKFGNGGKHPYVEIETREGTTAKVSIPSSTGNFRSKLNTRTFLRHTLRDLGIEPVNKGSARTGAIGDKLAAAVAKAEPAPSVELGTKPLRPVVHVKRRAEPEYMPVMFDDTERLCPDAIRASYQSVASVPAPRKPEKEPETMLAMTEPKPAPERPQFVKLTQAEQVAATLLIMQHATVDRIAKSCAYSPSYSDEKLHADVVAESGRPLKLDTIVDFRRNHFGATPAEREREKAKAGPPCEGSNRQLIEVLQTTVASLVSRVTSLEDAATRPTT